MEPIFFKYIIPSACTERLKLPPAHKWNKNRDFPDNVFLTDKRGNRWPVKLEKVDNYVCFVNGWLDFVKDNNVEVGDFVVFENVGPNVYSVLLLDPNTKCEKEGGLKSEEEHSRSFEEQTTGAFEGSDDVKEEEEDITEEDDDDDVMEEEEEGDDDDDDDDEYEDEEDDDFDLEEQSNVRGISSHRNGGEIQKRRRKSPHAVAGAINRVTDIYGNAIFKSRGIPLPKNPYFITRKRANRNDELYVPLHVIEDYNIDLPKKTIIRDRRGGEWPTELNIWKDGRRWYYGGWSNFCRKNHIVDETVTCICEFVEEAGKGLILFIYKLTD